MTRQTTPALGSEAGGAPFFSSFQREMNRLVDQFRNGFPTPEFGLSSVFSSSGFPAIDVAETEAGLEVTAEVPGVKEDDLDVSISGDVLTLKGEKSSDHEEKEDNYHLVERQFGSFLRRIPLGFVPEDDGVDAAFSDGVLKLKIKKPASVQAEVKKINIKKN